MLRITAGLALLIPLAFPSPGRAQGCGAAQTQTAMNACANDALVKADAALNAAYAQVTRRLRPDPTAAQRLVAAQKAWIAFRDGECAFEASGVEGGSVHPFIEAQCLEGITRRRTEEIRSFLHCQEGDLGCPVPPR